MPTVLYSDVPVPVFIFVHNMEVSASEMPLESVIAPPPPSGDGAIDVQDNSEDDDDCDVEFVTVAVSTTATESTSKTASKSRSTSRKNNSIAETCLSPSSHTRSQSVRKRTTPPRFVSTTEFSKRRQNLNKEATRSPLKEEKRSTTMSSDSDDEIEQPPRKQTKTSKEKTEVKIKKEEVNIKDRNKMNRLERIAILARQKSNDDHKCEKKVIEANEAERNFDKALFKLYKRESTSTKWWGWKQEYFQCIELTEYGLEYSGTRK